LAIQNLHNRFGTDHNVTESIDTASGHMLSTGTRLNLITKVIALQEKVAQRNAFTVSLTSNTADQVVVEVRLTGAAHSLPTLKDLASHLGIPDCVIQSLGSGNTPITLVYRNKTGRPYLRARILSRGFGWDQPLFELAFTDASVFMVPGTCATWRGFTTMQKYLP
jgi:hypothetical protein